MSASHCCNDSRGLDAPSLGVLVLLLGGLAVALAWVTDLPFIREVAPGLPATQFTTALCFIAAAAMVYFVDRCNGRGVLARVFCSAMILLVMGWTLGGYCFAFDPRLDESLHAGDRWPGRPAFPTALAFVLAGLWGLLHRTPYAPGSRFAGAAVIALALPALIGHVTRSPALYYQSMFGTGMSLVTAVLLMVLGTSVHSRTRRVQAPAVMLCLMVLFAVVLSSTVAKLSGVQGPPPWPGVDAGSPSPKGR